MGLKVLLHGAGAIGSIYTYILIRAGCDVTVVCRSNYAAVKANGFRIDSALYGQDIHVKPHVAASPQEAADTHGPFDVVLVCTKALPENETSKVIAPAVGHKTLITLIQNGVGIEDEYATAFPQNLLASCVVYLPTTQIAPGHIRMDNIEQLEIGTFPADHGKSHDAPTIVDEFVAALKAGGSNVTVYADIQIKRWTKLMVNASWNPICAMTLSRDVAFLASSSSAEKVVRDVMNEIVGIVKALYKDDAVGVGMHDRVDRQIDRALQRKGGPGVEPSMLADVLSGRRMEVEAILGNPLRIAQKLRVDTPRLEMLYALCKGLDEALALREPGKSLSGEQVSNR